MKVKKPKEEYKLPWLRIYISCHKFPNIRERFEADLGGKLNKKLGLLDLDTLSYNCNTSKKIDGECPYNNLC